MGVVDKAVQVVLTTLLALEALMTKLTGAPPLQGTVYRRPERAANIILTDRAPSTFGGRHGTLEEESATPGPLILEQLQDRPSSER